MSKKNNKIQRECCVMFGDSLIMMVKWLSIATSEMPPFVITFFIIVVIMMILICVIIYTICIISISIMILTLATVIGIPPPTAFIAPLDLAYKSY